MKTKKWQSNCWKKDFNTAINPVKSCLLKNTPLLSLTVMKRAISSMQQIKMEILYKTAADKNTLFYLRDEEKQHLKAGSDSKGHVFFNGIFTSLEKIAVYAVHYANNQNEPFYLIVFPQADSAVLELMLAGYQKFLEKNFLV
ncbi:hypothetical protein [Bartonella sp. AP58NXGY]|uniref:hypothetical protein n=1 Tax=Bartonella sp. AP58NXGY TaxID=3243498 RepID=UPI0035CF66F1